MQNLQFQMDADIARKMTSTATELVHTAMVRPVWSLPRLISPPVKTPESEPNHSPHSNTKDNAYRYTFISPHVFKA
jgi:hypothetical protein